MPAGDEVEGRCSTNWVTTHSATYRNSHKVRIVEMGGMRCFVLFVDGEFIDSYDNLAEAKGAATSFVEGLQ